MSFAAISVSLTAVSVGVGAASAAGAFTPDQPAYPNTSASSKALADTNAAMLPLQRGLTAAQQTGGDYTFSLPAGASPASLNIGTTGRGWYDAQGNLISADQNYGQTALEALQNPLSERGRAASQVNAQTQAAFAQYLKNNGGSKGLLGFLGGTSVKPGTPAFDPTAGLTWKDGQTTMGGAPVTMNKDGTYTISFKGFGQGDIQAANAQKAAANQLALAQQFDPQFIAQALAQQKQADPESFAARAEEAKLIQDQISRPINSPVSDLLNNQVQDTLHAAGQHGLTDMDTQRLNAAVSQAQAERGGAGVPGDFASPLTTGFAGEQRQQAAAQGAMGFLASGSSPEDIAYRREQQNLANLSAEVNGKTPQSQFGSMSGAQSGPTPMVTANPLPVLPGGQDQAASQVAIQNAQTQNRFNANQINPWMQGVSSLIDVGSIAGNLGWKPFAPAS